MESRLAQIDWLPRANPKAPVRGGTVSDLPLSLLKYHVNLDRVCLWKRAAMKTVQLQARLRIGEITTRLLSLVL